MNKEPNNPSPHTGVGPKRFSKRGVRFLIGGLAGGTVLVVLASFAFDDWSYLTRGLTGLGSQLVN